MQTGHGRVAPTACLPVTGGGGCRILAETKEQRDNNMGADDINGGHGVRLAAVTAVITPLNQVAGDQSSPRPARQISA